MQVAVAGCGVVGLSLAISLARAGHGVTIYARELPPHVTSNYAGAVWLPLLVGEAGLTPPGYAELLEQWSTDTWAELVSYVGRGYGVRWIKSHEMYPVETPPTPYLRRIFADFEARFDDTLPGGNTYRWSFTTLLIEPPIYVQRLVQDFRDLGGVIREKAFASAEELTRVPERVIFNCTGLGSRGLFADPHLKGVKGQLLLHEPVELESAIGAYEFVLLPRSDALLLGSLFQREYDTEEPTAENDRLLWDTISQWGRKAGGTVGFPEGTLSRDKLRGSIAALRPYRSAGVRLEAEVVNNKHVVHNYGHGGSGLTLSWGCAKHAIGLVQHVLA
jgi:D-amino-acid oxidase